MAHFALSIPGICTNLVEIRAHKPESAKTPIKPHTGLWVNYAESAESGLSPYPPSASLPAIASLSPVFCPFTYPAALSSPLAGASRFPDARMKTGGYRGWRGWWRRSARLTHRRAASLAELDARRQGCPASSTRSGSHRHILQISVATSLSVASFSACLGAD